MNLLRGVFWVLASVSIFSGLGCSSAPVALSVSGTDFHMHVHSPSAPDEDMESSAGRALFAADSIGLSRAVVIPNGYARVATEAQAVRENDFARVEGLRYPGRVAAACAVNPTKLWAFRELQRCHSIGLRILKLHFLASGWDLRNPRHEKAAKDFLGEASRLGFVFLVHANYPRSQRGDEIDRLKALIETFPDSRWIIGHLFGREHAELRTLRHSNFVVEVSVAPIWAKTPEERAELVKTIRQVGVEKFVFGSDWPVLHPAETLKALRAIGLSEAELRAIVFENATRWDDLFSSRAR